MAENETFELAPLSDIDVEMVKSKLMDVSDLVWWGEDEELTLKFLNDNHLKNIVMKLLGFSTSEYNAPEDLKLRWLQVLRLEWIKRQDEKRASFNSKKS
jgi:hypothetical protein